jgi:hypothetical protein
MRVIATYTAVADGDTIEDALSEARMLIDSETVGPEKVELECPGCGKYTEVPDTDNPPAACGCGESFGGTQEAEGNDG